MSEVCTAIILQDTKLRVIRSKNLGFYLRLLRVERSVSIVFLVKGDYKDKIARFGIRRFLQLINDYDCFDQIVFKLVSEFPTTT